MAKRSSYKHLNDQELVYLALQFIIEEIEEYELPQVDENGVFGENTAVGFARNVLKWVKLPKKS